MAIDTTALRQFRLLTADTGATPILTEAEAGDFLAMHGLDPEAAGAPLATLKRAAADALDAIASSEALVSKKIRTQAGVSTDGPAVAAALRAHAKELRAQAAELDDDGDDVAFEVAEFTPYPTPVF
jgi:hypothetical protein